MGSLDVAQLKVRSTAGDAGRQDILDRMKTTRERLRFLASRLLQDRDSVREQRRLFDMLCDAVESHSAAAEQSLYAGLLAQADGQRLARRAVEAHDEAGRLIGELSDMAVAGEAWRAGVARLAGHLERYFSVEEGETFTRARTLLAGTEAARLGDKYERARRQWIETFGRLPAAHLHPADLVGPDTARRGRPVTWIERLRRPLRAAGLARSATAR